MSTCKTVALAVIIALCTGISRGQCPAKCKCNGTAVTCIDRLLKTIPRSLQDAISLNLSRNMIQSLPDEAFSGWSNLTEL
ncbi:hypothetical protein DPMN_182496 [Dreissena polymorpha]|uniref:LRRNT domain-containing protein n=1 Tax=Dreissena polymorpha TaxID=45954 RepID=A0A9D4I4Q0_DREPO|nr:hypothetical protein DPMN_182496 [Dreissena polymorpha]